MLPTLRFFEPGKFNIRLVLLIVAFGTVHLYTWFNAELFNRLDATIVDWMTAQGIQSAADSLPDESHLVFIDANFYYQRTEHSRIIGNLAELGVSAQLVNFIFQAKVGDAADLPLIQAVASAGNVYFGMDFESINGPNVEGKESLVGHEKDYLERTQWRVNPSQRPDTFYLGSRPRIPFYALLSVSRGLGFLNLRADPDGVLRRTPLLVRYRGAIYPSFAFRAVCDYLGVSAADIIVIPGKKITLKNAKPPAAVGSGRDIVIPIDAHGNVLIKYTGTWNRINHYSYSEVHHAAENADASPNLKNELAHKITILTENIAAELKVPPVNEDGRLSTGAVHALIIENILSENFLRELSEKVMILIELVLLSAVLVLSLYLASIGFVCGTLIITAVYVATGGFLFLKSDVVVQFARPVSIVGTAALMIIIVIIVERAILFARTVKAKQLAERELEIGRQIQSGFFPSALPDPRGWEIAASFEAARHVAGDFYDAFPIGNEKHIGFVIADVCDKGVGAALYMALFRSLIRILSGAADNHRNGRRDEAKIDPRRVLSKTICTLNDYISVTHEKDGMFATLFIGILDPDTDQLYFINGGHEPPVLIGRKGIKERLDPTGPAVGAFPHLDFSVGSITFEPGDILFGYTDGVIDARNQAGEMFTRDRLMAVVSTPPDSPNQLITEVKAQVEKFTHGKEQFDDITLIAVGRDADNEPS